MFLRYRSQQPGQSTQNGNNQNGNNQNGNNQNGNNLHGNNRKMVKTQLGAGGGGKPKQGSEGGGGKPTERGPRSQGEREAKPW